MALVLLFNSYYVFIGREVLSSALTLLAVLVVPVVLCPAFGSALGAHGVWVALGMSPCIALAITALYVLARGGCRAFPYLLSGRRDGGIRVFDLEIEPVAVCAASASVETHLKLHGVDDRHAAKAALLVEEVLMAVMGRNEGRRIKAEVTVDLNDGLELVIRDDGEIFDITDADASVSSLRSYLVSNLMTVIPGRRNVTTTGFNRNVFKL